ncbi:DNA-3-methyladenine glycosylase I [Lactiplantibacillus sp. WILCCON 0030]|uniref:DNA-3-methyladenine glycosylase I n=1 Tax=Lactiplantibacillus brownii TaxID=3069269 RepID=A0ABU1A5S1_9LACO|nr:DNA-3-methyladenine glycosylase I [Lactiplantibacillus brownii]MDQ7936278.1 DNA-3-methyladenine glycosylase I [Lactiplantibacillus brownii]
MKRCDWAEHATPLMQQYHDNEWGRPEHDQQKLFELLCLETYQAGLSWQTVLNKRAAFNEDFYNYDVAKVAAMTATDMDRLLQDARIIRHRQKLAATINNAQVIQNWPAGSTYSAWLWSFVDDKPIRQAWQSAAEIPTTNELAKRVSKAMKARGFKFVGPTTIYSYLQAAGLINDHLADCDWAPEN